MKGSSLLCIILSGLGVLLGACYLYEGRVDMYIGCFAVAAVLFVVFIITKIAENKKIKNGER